MSHPFRRAAAVTAATAVAAGALLLAPLPAHADADEVLLITLDAADAAAASDLDVVEASAAGVVVLGDAATQDLLADRGAEPLEVDTYAESIVAPAASASRFSVAAAAAAEHPLPERLADEEYETFFGGYRTVEAYEEFAHDIADAYPEIAELVDFGDSWLKTQGRGGHDLLAVRLTADVSEQPEPTDGQEGRPRFVLVAQAHAREIITSELAWRYATELLDGYGTDPQVTALLDSTEVWINFQANPDGIDLVEEALETSPVNASGDATPPNSSKAWQRKNVNDSLFAPTSSSWNSQQPGIDLNRNFGFHWGEASSSTNPNSATYRGTAPHSEPEVAAASALLTDLFGVHAAENANPAPSDRTGTYVNLHSYSDYVIYPYAYSAADDVPNLEAIKANAFRQSYASGFATGKAGEILYDNSGNDIDWIYSQLGVPAYTYEIGTSRTGGFFPAYSRVPGFFDSVAPGIRFAAEASYAPYTAALGGLVEDVVIDRVQGGSVQVTGVAGDERYGTHAGSQQRRPAVTDIVAVEAALATDRSAIDETVALELDGQGTTVRFTGVIPVTAETADERAVFVRARNGSGEWGPWRAATVPLEPTATAVSSQGRALTASVTPEVAGPAAVTGTVQFALDGTPVGEPVPVRHGVARIAVPAHLGTGDVTAVYGGDGYHDGSTGLSRLGRN